MLHFSKYPVLMLTPLLFFFLLIGTEINPFSVAAAGGERVRFATEYVGGNLSAGGAVSLGIHLYDLIFLLLFLFVFLNVVLDRVNISEIFSNLYQTLLAFIIFGLLMLFVAFSDASGTQLTVMTLYTTKILEVSLILPILFVYMAKGYDPRRLTRAILAGTLAAALVGFASFAWKPMGVVFIPDRVTFYGGVVLASIFLLCVRLDSDGSDDTKLVRTLTWIAIVLGLAAAMICGKRSVMLAAVIGTIVTLWSGRWERRAAMLIVAAGLAIASEWISSRLIFTMADGAVFDGLAPIHSNVLLNLPDPFYSIMLETQGLDLSIRERIAKIFYGLYVWIERPILGSGLNSSPIIGFLPDNLYTALLVETGLVGWTLFGIFLWQLWRGRPGDRSRTLRLPIIVAFLAMGTGAYTITTFNVFALLLGLCALTQGLETASNRRPAIDRERRTHWPVTRPDPRSLPQAGAT